MAQYACEQYLEPGERMCTKTHCTFFGETSQYNRFCLCKKADGTIIPQCQVKGPTVPMGFHVCYNKKTGEEVLSTAEACQERRDKDPNWSYGDCYCCCSCFAWDTRIAIAADAVKVIQEFQQGDQVYAASIQSEGGKLHVHWRKRPVVMSSGTGPNSNGQEMIVVQYGENGEILVTPDHLFLEPNGKLVRADRLTSADSLVDIGGNGVPIHAVQLGLHTGGIHHISTEFDPNAPVTPNGHLLSSNGVITADFVLQISQQSEEVVPLLSAEHDRRPTLGSEGYAAKAGRHATVFSSRRTKDARPIRAAFFQAHEPLTTPPGVPEWAPRFLTDEQSAEIADAPHVPATVERNRANYEYLKRLYNGFFPDVKFHLEWADETPNLYAFRQFGVNTVYIAGRLLRTTCIERDGMALILAHGIARLLGLSVLDSRGYDCTGAADFDAISYVMPTAFYFDKVERELRAFEQVKTLFGFASFKEGGDVCTAPTLSCRLKAMQDAMAGFELPACAGGVPPAELKLESAEYVEVDGMYSVTAYFNVPLMPSSAQDVTKYTITPVTVVTTALVSLEDPAQIVLTVTLPDPPKGEYTLEVADILAADGSTLDPEHRTARFTVAKRHGKR